MPDAAPVAPTRRNPTLDVLRGVAVLGILVINVVWIGAPGSSGWNPAALGLPSTAETVAWWVQDLVFEGRMRGLFSLLFGAGLVLMSERGGAGFSGIWVRRCLWLIVFGAIHGFVLLWEGDILLTYGVAGLLLLLARRWSTPALLLAAAALLTVTTALSVVDSLETRELAQAAEPLLQRAGRGAALSESEQATVDEWQEILDAFRAPADEVLGQIDNRRSGYAAIFVDNAPATLEHQTVDLIQSNLWDALWLMLLGMVLARAGVLTGQRSTAAYRRIAVAGYAIGLPPFIVANALWAQSGYSAHVHGTHLLYEAWYQPGRALVAVAHAAMVVLWVRTGAAGWLLRRLAAVGRMAFSNYIFQTAASIVALFGFGFGLYGSLDRAGLMLLVLAIWSLQLIASPLWLQRYRFGPLEWLWRSLVRRQRQPLRYRTEDTPA